MDAERAGHVQSVDALHASIILAADCSNCTGCRGRCSLAGRPGASERIELPLSLFDVAPTAGLAVRLYLPEAALLRQARSGYGLPLLGLVIGAICGHGIALAVGATPDPPAVLFAAIGTLVGFRASKRALSPPCRIGPALASARDIPISIQRNNEDCTP